MGANKYRIWHAGNDGAGSGLDADTCDGQHLGTTANVTFGNVNVGGALTVHTGGNNTYGRINGYGNDHHFMTMRGIVANQSGLSITAGHQMTFVEHADDVDEGWYFKSNASGTYRELAHIDGKSDLHLVSYDGTNGHKIVFRGGSSSQRANLAKIEAKQTTNWGGQIELAGKSSNGSLSDAYNVGLRVNGDGKVTKPEQPIASVSSGHTVDLSNVVLTSSNFYNHTHINNGNHWNQSNGRFTCPVDGIYRIFFRASATINSNIRLRKNGSTINEAYDDNHGHTYTTSSEAIFSASSGDYLDIQVHRLKTVGGTQHKQVTFELLA